MSYYNKNAELFFDSTVDINMSDLQRKFIYLLPRRTEILDVGCGSGRDTKYFLENGFSVVSIEPARELAELAEAYIKQEVVVMRVEDLPFEKRFSGIWACASLLHIHFSQINVVLRKLYKSLIDGGVLFISVKHGNFEGERSGRFFCDYTEEKFETTDYKEIGFDLVGYSYSTDEREGRENEKWLNIILER